MPSSQRSPKKKKKKVPCSICSIAESQDIRPRLAKRRKIQRSHASMFSSYLSLRRAIADFVLALVNIYASVRIPIINIAQMSNCVLQLNTCKWHDYNDLCMRQLSDYIIITSFKRETSKSYSPPIWETDFFFGARHTGYTIKRVRYIYSRVMRAIKKHKVHHDSLSASSVVVAKIYVTSSSTSLDRRCRLDRHHREPDWQWERARAKQWGLNRSQIQLASTTLSDTYVYLAQVTVYCSMQLGCKCQSSNYLTHRLYVRFLDSSISNFRFECF